MTHKPTLLVDFDNVLHRYTHGWYDGTAYDVPIKGSKEALQDLVNRGYEVVIFSSRDATQIESWLRANRFPPYRVTNIKEPAVAIVDDRAIRFTDWSDALGQILTRYPVRRDNANDG